MVFTGVMQSIAEFIISFIAGAGLYYLFSGQSRQESQLFLGKITSDIINFVLFIWLSKVILNFTLFIREPLTVLAYPGNADSFYIAFFLSAGLFLYQHIRKKSDQSEYIKAFSLFFLLTSLVYESIQLFWNNNDYSFGYLLLLSAMLILFLIFEKRMSAAVLILSLIVMWSAGMLLLANVFPFVTVFNYTMRPWFIILFFVISSLIVFYTARKEVKK